MVHLFKLKIFFRIILATIVLFLLICTFLQLVQEKMNISSKFVRELSKLSLYSSAKRIFNTNINPSSFPALHGIRTLSIFWVVLGHSYTSRSLAPFVNSAEEYKVSINNVKKSFLINFYCLSNNFYYQTMNFPLLENPLI